MLSEPTMVTQPITPTQVWALIPLERQQHVVRLLAHLAVHIVTAQTSCQRSDVVVKERDNAHPSNSKQDPA
jgi:hypothetical protein